MLKERVSVLDQIYTRGSFGVNYVLNFLIENWNTAVYEGYLISLYLFLCLHISFPP